MFGKYRETIKGEGVVVEIGGTVEGVGVVGGKGSVAGPRDPMGTLTEGGGVAVGRAKGGETVRVGAIVGGEGMGDGPRGFGTNPIVLKTKIIIKANPQITSVITCSVMYGTVSMYGIIVW